MTISNSSARNDYTGNGATATYSYGFKIFNGSDLLVTQKNTSNVETTLVLTNDYTVTGVGGSNGGTIILTAGNLPSGYHLTIRKLQSLIQETDIRNLGAFYPEIHEDTFDFLTGLDQQQQDEIDRSFKLSETTVGVDAELPAPQAGKVLRWNSAEDGIENASIAELGSVTAIGYNLQLESGELSVAPAVIASGTNTYTATLSPAIAAYALAWGTPCCDRNHSPDSVRTGRSSRRRARPWRRSTPRRSRHKAHRR